jgi:hypothetical protein
VYKTDKILYKDGIGCCVYTEPSGLCFDFKYEDLDEILEVLGDLKDRDAQIYVGSPEDLEHQEHERKWQAHKNKWWVKLHDKLDYIQIAFYPFSWKFEGNLKIFGKRAYAFITKQNVDHKTSTWVHGIHIGPFVISW